MIQRLVAYSFILLGVGGTVYMGVEGIYGEEYAIPMIDFEIPTDPSSDSSQYVFIDVRTMREIEQRPAPWPIIEKIPLLLLEDRCLELNKYKDRSMVVLCDTGNRSRQGARILRMAGFDAFYLETGMFYQGESN